MAPSLIDMELDEAESIGFSSKEEFIEDAVNTYLASRKDKRLDLAIPLYKDGKISIGRAVELAGTDIESFKEELAERNIPRKTGSAAKGKEAALKYREQTGG